MFHWVGPSSTRGRFKMFLEKWRFRRETITDGRRHEAVLREGQTKFVVALSAPGAKPASLNANDRRKRSLAILRPHWVCLSMTRS